MVATTTSAPSTPPSPGRSTTGSSPSTSPPPVTPSRPRDNPLTVVELVARYWAFAKTYYVKNGKPTGEIPPLKQALKFLRRLYGPTPATEFSPLKLKAVREAMIRHPITRTVRVTDPGTGE